MDVAWLGHVAVRCIYVITVFASINVSFKILYFVCSGTDNFLFFPDVCSLKHIYFKKKYFVLLPSSYADR